MNSVVEHVQPELLTKTDVGKLLQVSGRQVENLVRDGRLPKPVRLGSHPRWRRAELLKHLDELTAGDEGGTR